MPSLLPVAYCLLCRMSQPTPVAHNLRSATRKSAAPGVHPGTVWSIASNSGIMDLLRRFCHGRKDARETTVVLDVEVDAVACGTKVRVPAIYVMCSGYEVERKDNAAWARQQPNIGFQASV